MALVDGIVDSTTEGFGDREGNADCLREGATVIDGFMDGCGLGS